MFIIFQILFNGPPISNYFCLANEIGQRLCFGFIWQNSIMYQDPGSTSFLGDAAYGEHPPEICMALTLNDFQKVTENLVLFTGLGAQQWLSFYRLFYCYWESFFWLFTICFCFRCSCFLNVSHPESPRVSGWMDWWMDGWDGMGQCLDDFASFRLCHCFVFWNHQRNQHLMN